MTALSGAAIRDRLEDGDLKNRLVVSPVLDPAGQLKDSQSSIDVRLGFEFAVVLASEHGHFDEFDDEKSSEANLEKFFRKQYVPFGKGIVIHPHQLVLASTLEYIRLPYDLMSYVVGRSTWGRLGLIVATAVGIHPLFSGTLTLELRNLGETPIKLYPGHTIAQLFFHKVEGAIEEAEGTGQYSGSVDIIPRRVSSETTRNKLIALRSKPLSKKKPPPK